MESPTVPLSLGRCFFGAATLASGLLQLVTGQFVRLVPELPAWVPAQPVAAYLVGAILVAAGLVILRGRRVRTAATVVGVMILLMVLLVSAPRLVVNAEVDRPFLRGFMWTNPLKALALVGGAAILAGRMPDQPRPLFPLVRGIGRWEPAAAFLLALFLVVCGMQHFAYRDFVVKMIPSWMPAPTFWTYFTGVALMAGGAGMLVPRIAKLAASLSGLMIFLWVLMLHIPRALAGPNHANETAGIFEALALSGVALMVAATRAPGQDVTPAA